MVHPRLFLSLIDVPNDCLAHRFEAGSVGHAGALVAEPRPQHRVAAAAQTGLAHQPQRGADLPARVVVTQLHTQRVGCVGRPDHAVRGPVRVRVRVRVIVSVSVSVSVGVRVSVRVRVRVGVRVRTVSYTHLTLPTKRIV